MEKKHMNETAWQALEIMWKGMVSIFVVIIILTLLVYMVTKFIKDPEKRNEESGAYKGDQ